MPVRYHDFHRGVVINVLPQDCREKFLDVVDLLAAGHNH
jgi:hypothetical protein